MFHYECRSKGGEVIEACIDGFMFGVCCEIKKGVKPAKEDGGSKTTTTTPDPIQAVESIIETLRNATANQ